MNENSRSPSLHPCNPRREGQPIWGQEGLTDLGATPYLLPLAPQSDLGQFLPLSAGISGGEWLSENKQSKGLKPAGD